ncbi:universal stress protein [Oscillatoria sp. FACHB-1406]|uniref:universal stress protein n=1 Tax=Oscillatoria sp. FACHB-1406 TaxID=2692846 RepID=UPI0016878BA2|nr:universal stress protein [Oscillatoria sp. FACHB-1406]MBD2578151.1 universal stress protein [Oscillatoria sp. FACHB-1406]
MFTRSLICTDFSDSLDRLTRFVPQLAHGGLRQIVFVHSVPLWEGGQIPHIDEEKVEKAKVRLNEALSDIPEGIEVIVETPSGRPVDTLPKLVGKYQSEVVITGSSIRNLLQEKVAGSTTLELTRLTATPLMILRPQLISTYRSPELALRCENLWSYLLIPYNDGDTARYLLDRVKNCLEKSQQGTSTQCMLLWVVDDGQKNIPVEYRIQEAEQKLAAAKVELEALGVAVQTQVRTGTPFLEIIKTAGEFDISAIATSHLTRGALLDWTVPSIANEILRRSWFPVLFFPPR